MDYSSAFNTIVPATLVVKLQTLGLNRSLCSWILDLLTGRSQVVRMGNNTSSPLTLNTGAPQGCVLSPLLYSLYTHDCTATHSSNVIIKFADDTTVIGLINDNDEMAYREEVSTLTKWCQENHLSLNIDKTKELVVDYRRQSREHTPITIDKTPVERVNSFKFLGIHITEDLTWSAQTDAVLKKAHQRPFLPETADPDTHIYTHMYVYIYICMYICMCVYVYMYVCICMCVYVYMYVCICTVGTESIQTPLHFSLFVILQPFAKII